MSLTDSLTNSLTHSRLVNLIDVTLAFEDANSKLVEVFLLLMLMMRIVLTTATIIVFVQPRLQMTSPFFYGAIS